MPESEPAPLQINEKEMRARVKEHPDLPAFLDSFNGDDGRIGIFGISRRDGALVGVKVSENGTTRGWVLPIATPETPLIWKNPTAEPLKGVDLDMHVMDVGPNKVYIFPPKDVKGELDEELLEPQSDNEPPDLTFYRHTGPVTFLIGGELGETGDKIKKSPNNKVAGAEVIPFDLDDDANPETNGTSTGNGGRSSDLPAGEGSFDLKAYYDRIKGPAGKKKTADIQAAIDNDPPPPNGGLEDLEEKV